MSNLQFKPASPTEYNEFIELLCMNCENLISVKSPSDAFVLCENNRLPKWDKDGCSGFKEACNNDQD